MEGEGLGIVAAGESSQRAAWGRGDDQPEGVPGGETGGRRGLHGEPLFGLPLWRVISRAEGVDKQPRNVQQGRRVGGLSGRSPVARGRARRKLEQMT
jgi:hypothetical protein